ncbi:Methyl-accepting chemotaxis protein [Metapseudomonas furukawaii]|uniref:Methyl-accepting chemotaxis protein n=1 Tax=Metapseudomonas furukawaii TaxID=1149133 RepID=A0AAD1BYQ9_METFU|nr:Methyl-accepting chemotaxis protein [Pseudomonas furukawaii]BAU72369.1 methyl-accepting chemotaxis protein [Pseudomonas furukawaii]
MRDKFVSQVEQITWAYKLAPETINLPARGGVAEIQVFDITQKTAELDEDVLRAIDRAIPLPIIFQLHHEQRTRMVAAFKRPSEADASKWVIDGYFAGSWLPAESPRQALPVALDLQGLYEQLLRSLLPSPARPGESLPEQLQRLNRLRSLHSEHAKLDARLHKEKQFNRKVALNAQLREIQNEIAELSA